MYTYRNGIAYLELERNPSRKDHGIAQRNIRRILSAHFIPITEVDSLKLTLRQIIERARDLRAQNPHLSIAESQERVRNAVLPDGHIKIFDDRERHTVACISEAAALGILLPQAKTRGGYVENVRHSAYCGCHGCGKRMANWRRA